MRRLVACPQCRRQFDASRLTEGSKFHCLCGQPVTVVQPKGHDAAVVRCSSCGAPRQERTASCGHCASDYTLHERDLHTVCPQCLARVSDRAKFCHHCAQALAATMVAGSETRLGCPHCVAHAPLASRQWSGECLAVLECGRCAGLWLEAAVFEELVRRARDKTTSGDAALSEIFAKHAFTSEPLSDAPPASPANSGAWRYRQCPVCKALMQRRQYAKGSGVIIDVCRHDGIWFDADELHRILLWVRGGGLQRAERRTADSERAAQRLRAMQPPPPPAGAWGHDEEEEHSSDLNSIAGALASLFQIF